MPSGKEGAGAREGRAGLTGDGRPARQDLADIQRMRILAAMVDVASEQGLGYATVARVVARSGVSRRTFYEQFVDREECFLAALEQVVERMAAVVGTAYREPIAWRERVRAGLATLLQFLDLEPAVARLVIVETLGAGPKALERRKRWIAEVVAVIDEEGRTSGKGDGPPPLTAEGVVGGVLSLIHSRLVDGGEGSLVGLLNPLVSMIVLPYLGPAAARRELQQPTPAALNSNGKSVANPLRDLEMRLTYRTVRVLLAIGELDGQGARPSNRQVGDAAGIRDQGQVSKLLARLEQLGLIRNAAEPPVKGEPNAWRLTERGREVREAVAIS